MNTRKPVAIVLALLVLAVLGAGCDSEPAQAAIANPDPQRCIVSGEKLPRKPKYVEVEGKRYALCCEECEPALRKDPEHYRKNPGSGSMSRK